MLKGSHDFEKDTVIKKPLEYSLYEKAHMHYGITGDSTIVAGPDIVRHILSARRTVSCTENSEVKIVEIDANKHLSQKQTLDDFYLPGKRPPLWMAKKKDKYFESDGLQDIKHRLYLELGNISKAQPTKFIDADLMGIARICGQDLITTLKNQREAFPTGTSEKAFIFTVSTRNGGSLLSNVSWVMRTLVPTVGCGCVIGETARFALNEFARRSATGFKGNGVQSYDIESLNESILHDARLYFYQDDGGPMLTGMLIYS